MKVTSVKGGQKLDKYLANVAQRLGNGSVVRVGFLEDATYPIQDKTARLRKGVASLNAVGPRKPNTRDFVGPRPQTLAPSLRVATVAFWNNFGTKRAPARPFFSDMIAEESPKWGTKLARLTKAENYNTKVILEKMGEGIQGQLVKKIKKWPADNAPLTVAIKGFNKGLIDSAIMQNNVGYQVVSK